MARLSVIHRLPLFDAPQRRLSDGRKLPAVIWVSSAAFITLLDDKLDHGAEPALATSVLSSAPCSPQYSNVFDFALGAVVHEDGGLIHHILVRASWQGSLNLLAIVSSSCRVARESFAGIG